MLKNWTKADDEKLRLLDSYGVTVSDMAKVLGITYNSVFKRCERLGLKPNTQIPNEGTFSEERLALQETRENICVLYIAHINECDTIAYVAKACNFKRSQVEKCLIECHADGTYRKVLKRINNYQAKVGQI